MTCAGQSCPSWILTDNQVTIQYGINPAMFLCLQGFWNSEATTLRTPQEDQMTSKDIAASRSEDSQDSHDFKAGLKESFVALSKLHRTLICKRVSQTHVSKVPSLCLARLRSARTLIRIKTFQSYYRGDTVIDPSTGCNTHKSSL